MTSAYYQNQINKIDKHIADLYKKIADFTKKENDKNKQIDSVNKSINKNTSASAFQSKQRQIQGYQKEIANFKTKVADLQKQIANKSTELGRKKQDLRKAEEKEQKKLQQDQKDFQKKLKRDLEDQKKQLDILVNQNYSTKTENSDKELENKKYDFFISHASEDKNDIVKELAEALKNNGFEVWYDDFVLKLGDSLRQKIDYGLSKSRFGIVIVSPSFINKKWPEYELNGMVAREMNGHKVILPIWHKVTKNEVLEFSPTLADKVALNTSIHTIEDIVQSLKEL